jgi:hypothetical protein
MTDRHDCYSPFNAREACMHYKEACTACIHECMVENHVSIYEWQRSSREEKMMEKRARLCHS